jgi:hypothetical protein
VKAVCEMAHVMTQMNQKYTLKKQWQAACMLTFISNSPFRKAHQFTQLQKNIFMIQRTAREDQRTFFSFSPCFFIEPKDNTSGMHLARLSASDGLQ